MKKLRKQGILACLAVCLSMVAPNGSHAALIQTAPDSPSLVRLSWTQDPRTTMTVTWQDAADTERAWVEYTSGSTLAETEASGQSTFRQDRTRQDTSRQGILEKEARLTEHRSTLSDGGTQWTATLDGLQPGTTYRYRINSVAAAPEKTGGLRFCSSPEYQFTTQGKQPADENKTEENLVFAYFGDVQVNREAEPEFTRWGQLAQAALAHSPDLQFGIMGGDIVESGIRTEQFDMFFDAASPVFSGIPLFTANGNHESNFLSGKPELYLDVFTLPENGPDGFKEEFYSFDAGPTHILVLNSWVYSGEQKLADGDDERISSWIRQDLEASDAPWKIAVMHHPLYAVHSDRVADQVQEHWGPILQEGGVKLLLCGHQHVYCRSVPLTDGLVDEKQGITQVMGVSGEKFYSSADERNMERTIYEVPNYQIVRVSRDSLEIQCFDKDGQELDYAVLSSSGKGTRPEGADRFADVTASDWFRDAVDFTVRREYFNGISEDHFAPQQTMTRAMFATVLCRLAGADQTAYTGQVFRDVPDGQWYSAGIAWAAEHGIVTGIGDSLFSLEDPVTREQIGTILFRYASQSPDRTESITARSDLSAFTDVKEISEWAADAMSWACGTHMINGMGGGKLAPKETATRAQVAQIIKNYEERVP